MTEEKTDVGHLIANVLMTSNQDNFDENMTRFLDETAELLGDVIGAACSNPETVFKRFGDCMAEAIGKRLASSNDRVEGRDAALSRRVPSHDGLGQEGAGK
jgi:hypothetical protein